VRALAGNKELLRVSKALDTIQDGIQAGRYSFKVVDEDLALVVGMCEGRSE
jgi:hypothetical protein